MSIMKRTNRKTTSSSEDTPAVGAEWVWGLSEELIRSEMAMTAA